MTHAIGHECAATRRRLAPASAVVCFCGIVTGRQGVSSWGAKGFRHGAAPRGFVTGRRPGVSSRGAQGFRHGAARGFISGHQSHSVAMISVRPSSEAISSHQRSLEVIRGHQRPSEAISGHQWPSEVIRGTQRHSYLRCRRGRPRLMYERAGLGALWQRPCLLAFDTQLEAIRGN